MRPEAPAALSPSVDDDEDARMRAAVARLARHAGEAPEEPRPDADVAEGIVTMSGSTDSQAISRLAEWIEARQADAPGLRRVAVAALPGCGAEAGELIVVLGRALQPVEVAITHWRAWQRYRLARERLKESLQEAVDLYQGDFLPGFYDDWTLVQREQLRQQYVLALQKLVQGYFRLGAYDQALDAGQRLIRKEPLNEWAYEQVIRLCALLGRRDDALRHYARLRRNLAEALGARPGPAIEQLMERVRSGAGVQPERRAPLFHDDIALPMIGRERTWERVRGMVDALRREQGGACIVRGEAGIGKTRLLLELAQYAEGWGFPLWMSKAVQESAAAPYQVLRQAIVPHLSPLLVERLRLEMDPVWLAALAQVFPEIRAWATDIATPPPLKKGEARSRGQGEGLGSGAGGGDPLHQGGPGPDRHGQDGHGGAREASHGGGQGPGREEK